jgi:predicted RNase H-like HicB family nuclease
MTFQVVLEPGEDGWTIASVPALRGCRSQGKTPEETLRNIREAIEAWLEAEQAKLHDVPPQARIELVNV